MRGSSTDRWLIFYAGQLHGEHVTIKGISIRWYAIPNGAYALCLPDQWFLSDGTPVLLEDVPPTLRALALLTV